MGEKSRFHVLCVAHNSISLPQWKTILKKKSQVERPYCVRGLKEHTSRVHEGTKPFICDSCKESFAKYSKLKLHIKGMLGGKKPFSCPICGSQFYFSTRMKNHIEKNHKSQDLTASEVWKNTLVEFMKAQSHSYVILVRNHLPKIPNWNYISKECMGEKKPFSCPIVAHNSISLPQ